jgi:hypothetical protein
MTWQLGPVKVRNNIISNQRAGTCMLCVEDYSHQRSAAQIGVTADGDSYIRPNSSVPKYLAVWSRGAGDPAAYTTLASFQSATGQEANGSFGTTSATTTTTTAATTTTLAPTTTVAPTTTTVAPTTTAAPTTTTAAPVPVPVVPPTTDLVRDAFGRTVSNGLGTADVGGAWQLDKASSFSVSNGEAWIAGRTGGNREAHLDVNAANVDLNADVTLDNTPSGGGAYLSLIGRRVSDATDYRLKLRYMPGGVVVGYLVRIVDRDETVLSTTYVPGLTVAPGETLRARLVVDGSGSTTTLSANVWRAGHAQPAGWQMSVADATPSALRAPGGAGILLYTSRSWRGATPVIGLDNLTIGTPG